MDPEEKENVEQLTRRNIRKYAVKTARAALVLIMKTEEEEPISLEETLADIIEYSEYTSSYIQTLREWHEGADD